MIIVHKDVKTSKKLMNSFNNCHCRMNKKSFQILSILDKTTLEINYELAPNTPHIDKEFYLTKYYSDKGYKVGWMNSSTCKNHKLINLFELWISKDGNNKMEMYNNNSDDNKTWGDDIKGKGENIICIVHAENNPKQSAAMDWIITNNVNI